MMNATGCQVSASAPDTVSVAGALLFTTATPALAAMRQALAAGGVRWLDLAGVHASDSAGLACVLAALAETRPSITVRNVPAGMRALASVCEVDRLLAE